MRFEEYDYIRGNTALIPERKKQQRQKENDKKKKLEQERIARRKKYFTRSVVSVASLALVLGTISLTVDNYVYTKQKELSTIKNEIEEQKSIYEALNVSILQYSSFDNVKDVAENKLGMVYADGSNTVTIDMSKDYFPNIGDSAEVKTSFLEKIKGIFS